MLEYCLLCHSTWAPVSINHVCTSSNIQKPFLDLLKDLLSSLTLYTYLQAFLALKTGKLEIIYSIFPAVSTSFLT